MKVAITGASGHIGISVMDELRRRGISFKALVHHDTHYFEEKNIEHVRGEVNNRGDMEKLLDGCDALIHSAAVISINGDPTGYVRQVNVEGVRNVMQTALDYKLKRVVHISSIHAYQSWPVDKVLDESSPLVDNDAFAYDKSKRDGQLLVKEFVKQGLPAVILNPTSVTGPPENKMSYQGKAMLDIYNKKIPAIFHGGFDWVDLRDVTQAVCNALTMGRVGENYLLAGKYYTMREIVGMISEIKGEKIRIPTIPVSFAMMGLPFVRLQSFFTGKEPLYTNESIDVLVYGNKRISSEKARKELNFECRDFKVTLRDLISWFKDNGYIKD